MDDSQQQNSKVWYAIRTYNQKEKEISRYLKEKGVSHFIPMCYVEKEFSDGKHKRMLVPAIHNLLFMPKERSEQDIRQIIKECPVAITVLRYRNSEKYYEIPDSQMVEFRAICDPNYKGTLYVSKNFADARPGQEVRVVHGAFKGLTGKLSRYKNRSYVVITLATIGVMIHIPKWYCEVVDNK